MITFYHIMDIDRFFQVINVCAGSIFFKTGEGCYVDIKHNGLIKNLLMASCGHHGVERLDLYIENSEDMAKLIQYMMECVLETSVSKQ